MPKLFLSFATEDYGFVIQLYSRLRRLQIDIWDYSTRDDEIPPGQKIEDGLAKAILGCDYFIPIITCHSTQASKTAIQFEVKFAFEQKKTWFPILVTTQPPVAWPGAFGLIYGQRYLEMDPDDDREFERRIQDLCGYMGVEYEPDHVDGARLPLYRKFLKEVEHAMAQIEKRRLLHKYDELISYINDFNLSYSEGEWEASLDSIGLLLRYNKRNSLIDNLYYPLIVKAGCEMELGKLADAEQTLLEATRSPRPDENAYGALGHVYYRLGKLDCALREYKRALQVCAEARNGEIVYNLFLTAMEILKSDDFVADDELRYEAHVIVDNQDYIKKILAIPEAIGKERWDIEYLIGLSYLIRHKMGDAFSCFSRLRATPVFSFSDESAVSEFNKGLLPASIQQLFVAKGFLLPAGIKVLAVAGDRWVLADGDSIYELRSEGEGVTVRYRELSLVIHLAMVLESKDRGRQAATLLRSDAVALNSRLLFHHYANLLVRMGDRSGALDVYANSLALPPYDVQFLVEYALFLRYFGCKEAMTRICTLATGLNDEGEKKKKKYYIGYAWFLLGKLETAQILFEQSGPYSIPYE